jgi:hypothetical protein
VKAAQDAMEHARGWVTGALANPVGLEAGARRFAMTLGRTMELALLVEHAQWCLDHGHGPKVMAAARRFTRHGVDLITDMDLDDSRLLA